MMEGSVAQFVCYILPYRISLVSFLLTRFGRRRRMMKQKKIFSAQGFKAKTSQIFSFRSFIFVCVEHFPDFKE